MLELHKKETKASEEQPAMSKKEFKPWIGRLLHINRVARPDITYQTIALARTADNASKENVDELSYLIRYLSTTKNRKLRLHRPESMDVTGYSDATWSPDYGDEYDNYRSTTGWTFQIEKNMLSWRSAVTAYAFTAA